MDQAFSSADQFFAAGGARDFSNVQTINPGQTATGQFYKYSSSFNGYDPATVFQRSSPPNTAAPVPSSQISNGSALNLPMAPTNVNNSGNDVVASTAIGSQPPLPPPTSSTPATDTATAGDYTQDPGYQTAKTQYDQSLNNYENAANRLPSRSSLLSAAEESTGANQSLKELQQINQQIAERTAAYNTAYQTKETQGIERGTPAIFYQGEQAAIQRQKAVEIGALGTIAAAKQGNYDLAESRARQTVDLQFQDAQNKIDNMLKFIQLNSDNLSRSEKLAVTKMEAKTAIQQKTLDQQKEARTFALTNGVTAPYYEMGGTVYRTSDGYAIHDPQEAAKLGVDTTNWSNVQKLNAAARAVKFETKNIGSGKNAVPYRFGYSASGNLVSKVDLRTGQEVSLSNQAAKNGSASNSTTSSPTGKTTVAQDVTSMNGQLSSVKGKDGYLSPQDYKKALNAWVNAGHSGASFSTNFKQYINPADPQDYK